jgi:hypothetical protein
MSDLGSAIGSAFDKGPKLVARPNFSESGRVEKLANKEIDAIISAQTSAATNALGTFNNIAVSQLLRDAFGLEAHFEDQTPEIGELSARKAELLASIESDLSSRGELNEIKSNLKRARKRLSNMKGPGKAEARRTLRAEIADMRARQATAKQGKQGKGARKGLNTELSAIDQRLTQLEAQPKKLIDVTEMSRDDLPPDSPLSSKNPLNIAAAQRNEQLIRALSGEQEPTSRLKRVFDDRERRERERLRRQIGPDFENSSQGIEALGRLNTERAEAEEMERKTTIKDFSTLSLRAQEAQDISKRQLLEAGGVIPKTQAGLSGALTAPATSALGLARMRQEERGQQHVEKPGTSKGARLGGAIGAGIQVGGQAGIPGL